MSPQLIVQFIGVLVLASILLYVLHFTGLLSFPTIRDRPEDEHWKVYVGRGIDELLKFVEESTNFKLETDYDVKMGWRSLEVFKVISPSSVGIPVLKVIFNGKTKKMTLHYLEEGVAFEFELSKEMVQKKVGELKEFLQLRQHA